MTITPFKLAFLDDPYASPFLIKTLERLKIPVVATPRALSMSGTENLVFLSEKEAIIECSTSKRNLLYTHSENSLSWIEKNIGHTVLSDVVRMCKNKVLFRQRLKDIYPGFFYREVKLNQIDKVDYSDLPKPFVIKPAVGFLSLGVHTVSTNEEWDNARNCIKRESSAISRLYPSNVVDVSTLIIEQCIFGDEYAFDCYFNNDGEPVILGIYKHLFASKDDVSDRVYITSHAILKKMLKPIGDFLKALGDKFALKNFPMHVEIRVDNDVIQPIELNPLRFGGWCTTADMTSMSIGINPYEYYFNQQKPHWDEIVARDDNNTYSLIVLDNKTGINLKDIKRFDYKELGKRFEHPLEVREIDYTIHPLFGFMFTKTSETRMDEIKFILNSDLREFIELHK